MSNDRFRRANISDDRDMCRYLTIHACRAIMHAGVSSLERKPDGKGTRFMLRCPICSDIMSRQEVEGRRKGPLVVFQCAKCFGLWVDRDTVIRLTHASALKADTALEFKNMRTQPRQLSLTCPRCAKLLTEHTGGRLPLGLHIDYCSACYGFWFDKGELATYKRGRANGRGENIPYGEPHPLFILVEVIADILTIIFVF